MRFENGLETQPPLAGRTHYEEGDVVNSDTYDAYLKLVLHQVQEAMWLVASFFFVRKV